MANLTIIRGLPGSGKTTEALKIVKETGSFLIDPDSLITSNGKYNYTDDNFKNAYNNITKICNCLNNMNCDVVFADVLPTKEDVYKIVSLFKGYNVTIINKNINVDDSYKNNIHNVHKEQINNMYTTWDSLI